MNPLVSICIPTYNREDTILDAIDCAVNQSYKNIEILVSDDQSKDNTVSIIKKIKDPRIKLVVQKQNLGMIQNWNYCIKEAKGEYIKFLHSDDLISNDCVEKELNIFLRHRKVSIVTCKRNFINADDEIIYTMSFGDKTNVADGIKYTNHFIKKIRENKIGEPSAVMFRKNDAIKAGLFDAKFNQLADLEFWIRLNALGDIGYINKPLCSFRVHEGSNTTKAIKDGRFIDETFVFIDKYFKDPVYGAIFKLSQKDRKYTIKLKTLDFLKNIKILISKGEIVSAYNYFNRLKKYVPVQDQIVYVFERSSL